MNALVVGGTSGMGLELGHLMYANGDSVIVTGRHDPEVESIEYRTFALHEQLLSQRIGEFVSGLPEVHTLVYAAGFFQKGHITELSDDQIEEMLDVGGRGLIYFVKHLLEKQGALPELITITSTSQWTPRELEPVYNFAKAGAGHFSNGISLDPRVGKALVAGPAGTASEFWEGTDQDTSMMMAPKWVAEQIMRLRTDEYSYRFAKILRATDDLPNRVEIEETRV